MRKNLWWWEGFDENVKEGLTIDKPIWPERTVEEQSDPLYVPPLTESYIAWQEGMRKIREAFAATGQAMIEGMDAFKIIWNEFICLPKTKEQIEGERLMRRYRNKRRIR